MAACHCGLHGWWSCGACVVGVCKRLKRAGQHSTVKLSLACLKKLEEDEGMVCKLCRGAHGAGHQMPAALQLRRTAKSGRGSEWAQSPESRGLWNRIARLESLLAQAVAPTRQAVSGRAAAAGGGRRERTHFTCVGSCWTATNKT